MAKSTKTPASLKPYKAFPLTAHRGAGQWCKKHRTRTYYFGSLSDPDAALAKFNREWSYVLKGLPPPVETDDGDACTFRTLCNEFLKSKRNKMAAGDLTELSYRDYYRTCSLLIDHFGRERRVADLRPVDFEEFRAKLAARYGVTSLLGAVNRCRVVLKFASDQRLIPQPVEYGQSFARPSKKVLRKTRNAAQVREFTRDELIATLAAADPQLRAMTLLGLNAGLGNTDVANLHESHLDLATGWLDYPRVKTEVPRRVPLWSETVASIKAVLSIRKRPRDPADSGIVFLTRTRQRWIRTRKGDTPETDLHLNSLSQAFGKLLHKLNINGRDGLNFYTLRRQFEIVAGESKDQVAVDAVMGHSDDSMAAVYRQNVVSDDRLRAVTEHVREWLWPAAK